MSIDSIPLSGQSQKFRGLSTDSKPNNASVYAKATFIEVDTGSEYEFTGSEWNLINSGGAKHVNPLPGPHTQGKNRFRASVSTTLASAVKVEFPSGTNITELVVMCTPATPEAAQTGDYGIIAIDPASDGIAQLMLTQTDSEVGDAGWFPIPPNELVRIPLDSALKEGSLGGGRIELLSVGVSMDFWIGGN